MTAPDLRLPGSVGFGVAPSPEVWAPQVAATPEELGLQPGATEADSADYLAQRDRYNKSKEAIKAEDAQDYQARQKESRLQGLVGQYGLSEEDRSSLLRPPPDPLQGTLAVPETVIPGSVPEPRPATGGGGGGGVSALSSLTRRLGGDYDEQIAGMQNEMAAREQGAEANAQALGERGDTLRQQAADTQAQGQARGDEARHHLDEIGVLARDYAEDKIDDRKWWTDKDVPQKIFTTIGAMMAGAAGGPEGAMKFINNQIDRSLSLQMEQHKSKGRALYEADNLFNNYLKVSGDETEAETKTRATLLDAAMSDAMKAGAHFQGQAQKAQMQQFIAALKQQRDMMLAKLSASGSANGQAGLSAAGLFQIDPKTIATGSDGQQYVLANPAMSDDVSNLLGAYGRINGLLKQGEALLKSRHGADYLPYSQSINQGEAVDAAMVEAVSKLANARGVPSSVLQIVQREMPQFGSRGAELTADKIPALQKALSDMERETLHAANAQPAQIAWGPGHGKHAGELTPYAKLGPSQRPAQAAPSRPTTTFKPGP